MRGRQNSRLFKFNTNDEALKFVLLYKDLFVPYSEYVCNYEPKNRDGEVINGRFVRSKNYGVTNENVKRMLEQGYRIYDDMKTVKVNIVPENLDMILSCGCFDKKQLRKNVNIFEMRAQ